MFFSTIVETEKLTAQKQQHLECQVHPKEASGRGHRYPSHEGDKRGNETIKEDGNAKIYGNTAKVIRADLLDLDFDF